MQRFLRYLVFVSVSLGSCARSSDDSPARLSSADVTTPSVTVDAASYAAGVMVQASYTGAGTSTTAWLSVSTPGSVASSYVNYGYTGGVNAATKPIAAPVGTWVVRLHPAGSNTVLAESAQFTAAGSAIVTPDAASYASGGAVTVAYSQMPGNGAQEWLGVALPSAAAQTFVAYHYTGGAKAGSMAFTGLADGTYVVRAHPQALNNVLGESYSFTVCASCGATGGSGNGGSSGSGGASASDGSGGGGASGTAGAPMAGNGGSAGGVSGMGVGGSNGAGGADGQAGGSTGGVAGAPSVAAFAPCPATGLCHVLPLGDSLTAGVGSSDAAGYRSRLYHLAFAAGKSVTLVGSQIGGPSTVDGVLFPQRHAGYPGYTLETCAQRAGLLPLVDEEIEAWPPHIVLLMIGTNDADLNNDIAHVTQRYTDVLDRVTDLAPWALTVVATLPPITDDAANARGQAVSATLPGVVATAQAQGRHVVLVDMYGAMTADANWKSDYFGTDRLHPIDAGYSVMSQAWYGAIGGYLK